MSKWLIAHTMGADGPGAKILSAKGFDLMHTLKASNVPEESGFGMQFFIYDYNGEKVMEHYGSLAFRSMEFFMMNKKIGVFVTFGGGGPPPARMDTTAVTANLPAEPGPVEPAMSHSGVRALVLEHFLGKLPLKPELKLDTAKYVGTYHSIPANPNDKPGGAPMSRCTAHSSTFISISERAPASERSPATRGAANGNSMVGVWASLT